MNIQLVPIIWRNKSTKHDAINIDDWKLLTCAAECDDVIIVCAMQCIARVSNFCLSISVCVTQPRCKYTNKYPHMWWKWACFDASRTQTFDFKFKCHGFFRLLIYYMFAHLSRLGVCTLVPILHRHTPHSLQKLVFRIFLSTEIAMSIHSSTAHQQGNSHIN